MRRRFVSFYVEWTEEADTDAIRALLRQYGARVIGMDEETDGKKLPGFYSGMIIRCSGFIWTNTRRSMNCCLQ